MSPASSVVPHYECVVLPKSPSFSPAPTADPSPVPIAYPSPVLAANLAKGPTEAHVAAPTA